MDEEWTFGVTVVMINCRVCKRVRACVGDWESTERRGWNCKMI